MQKQKLHESTKKLIVAGITIFIAMILLAVYFTVIVPRPTAGEKEVTLSIVYADKTYEYKVKTDAETVYDLLVEQNEALDLRAEFEDGQWGKYLISLKDTPIYNVDEEGREGYGYVYTVSDNYATGITAQTFVSGDRIEFKFLYSKYDENWTPLDQYVAGGGTKSLSKNQIILIVFIVVAAALLVYGFVNLGVYLAIRYKKFKRNREADRKLAEEKEAFDLKHIDIDKDLKETVEKPDRGDEQK